MRRIWRHVHKPHMGAVQLIYDTQEEINECISHKSLNG